MDYVVLQIWYILEHSRCLVQSLVQSLIPYSGKFLRINIFGNYNEHRISEIKFWNLVYLLQILPHYNYIVNYFSVGFSEIKF